MARNGRVIWSEGMFLRPQHYQQYTRYWENYIERRTCGLRSYSWGFLELSLDENLLSLGKIAIERAVGVFQDGTPFNIPANEDPPLTLAVSESVKEKIVYLCMPLHRQGAIEIDYQKEPESLARYVPSESEVEDNSTDNGNLATIQLGVLRTCLKLDSDHLDDYACLPVARVTEVKVDGSLQIDENFIPTVMATNASPELTGFLKELSGLLDHRAQALASHLTVPDKNSVAEIQDFLWLQLVNRYLALINHHLQSPVLHPEQLFQLMLMMSGELSTFTSSTRLSPTLPDYNHDNLQESFDPLFEDLRQSLSMVVSRNTVTIPLQERAHGIRVGIIADKSLLDDASFILAVTADIPTDEIRKRLPRQIKIGEQVQIRDLVNHALPGIQVRPLEAAPTRQVPFHAGHVYFELQRGDERWNQLKNSGAIAIHVSGENGEFPGLKMYLWAVRG